MSANWLFGSQVRILYSTLLFLSRFFFSLSRLVSSEETAWGSTRIAHNNTITLSACVPKALDCIFSKCEREGEREKANRYVECCRDLLLRYRSEWRKMVVRIVSAEKAGKMYGLCRKCVEWYRRFGEQAVGGWLAGLLVGLVVFGLRDGAWRRRVQRRWLDG